MARTGRMATDAASLAAVPERLGSTATHFLNVRVWPAVTSGSQAVLLQHFGVPARCLSHPTDCHIFKSGAAVSVGLGVAE